MKCEYFCTEDINIVQRDLQILILAVNSKPSLFYMCCILPVIQLSLCSPRDSRTTTEQSLIIGGRLQAKNFVLIIILFLVCKERGRQHIHFFSAY